MSSIQKVYVPLSQESLLCLLNTSDLDLTVNCDDPRVLGSSRFSMDPGRLHADQKYPSAAVRFVPSSYARKVHAIMNVHWKLVEPELGIQVLERASVILAEEKIKKTRCSASVAVRKAYHEITGDTYESKEQKEAWRQGREQLTENLRRRMGADLSHEKFDCIPDSVLRELFYDPAGYATVIAQYRKEIDSWQETPEWRERELARINAARRRKSEEPLSQLPGTQQQPQLHIVQQQPAAIDPGQSAEMAAMRAHIAELTAMVQALATPKTEPAPTPTKKN